MESVSAMEARVRRSSPPLKKSKGALERHALREKRRMELSKSVRKSGLQSELPKSVPKSGLQSDDPPSKLGLESVSPPSKIEQERLRSAPKNGLESVDSPSKDGLESFKPLPKSDPVPHGDSTHTTNPEMHVTLLIHDRRGAYQRSCIIKVDRDATIFELIRRIQPQTMTAGFSSRRTRLFYDGNILQDSWVKQDTLNTSNINEKTRMTLVLGHFFRANKLYLSTSVNAGTNLQATSNNYDEDLYIVDPQAHFDMLRQLERNVLQRSEYYQTKREYSLSSALDPVDGDVFFLDEIGLQPSLTERIRRSSIMTQVSIHLVSIDFLFQSPSRTLALHLRDIPIGDCWLMASRKDGKTQPHLQHSGIS